MPSLLVRPQWEASPVPFRHTWEGTANEAAFIVKTMSEVSQEADSFSYWCLSDIIASWRALGAPAWLRPQPLAELRAANTLRETPSAVTLTDPPDGGRVASFSMETPGIAMLEFAFSSAPPGRSQPIAGAAAP